MAHPRTFRFGFQAFKAPEGQTWGAYVRRVESLGYSTLFLPDHFGDQLAPVPALAVAAEVTTDLRIGILVADNDYRHPVVHAKDLATLDVLSGGRLEVGLGAGWMRSDYDESGIPYDRPGVRVDRFEEGVAVIKGLFADGPVTFEGRHYTVTGLDGLPKPVQRPHPPILIGAGGPRMLGIAARQADIVGVNPTVRSGAVDTDSARDGTAPAYDRKLADLRAAAGDRFADLELNGLLFFVVDTPDREGFAAQVAPGFGLTPEEVLDAPLALIGTTDQMCDILRERRERWGLSYITVQTDALETMAPVIERLAGT
jgi:probable F420-dependent oxidoreductase